MSDEKYVGAVAAAKQAALIKAYVDSKMKKDFVVNITFDSTSAPAVIDDDHCAVFNASTDKTFAEISAAVAAGKNVYGMWNGHKWPLYLASSTSFAFRGHIHLANLFGTVGMAIAICSIWQDGCDVTVSAGELPVPALDGSDDGKCIAVSGSKWAMKKAVVDDAMSATSTNPVQNKVVKAALDGKAGKDVAAADADGLMSAEDKVKLDGVEDGATKTIVDDAMSDTSTNPVQNKVVMNYIDSRGTLPPVSTQNDTMLIQVVNGSYALRTKESIFPVDDALDTESKNAVENGVIARTLEVIQGHTQLANGTRDGLMSASDYNKLLNIESGATRTIVDVALDASSTNPVQNKAVKTALDTKAGTAVATASANGLMSKDDKKKLDGVEAGANKTTVDAALDAASENPVQNKAVKTALDGKLDKTGGTLTGNLRVTGALFSGDGLSFGTGENIHFTKAADDAGKLAHGAAGVDDTVPLARLKVATPTEDDDAATKAYVDSNAAGTGAVRYDAAQTLDMAQQGQARANIGAVGHNSPQFQGFLALAPANAPLGTGVGLSPSGSGSDFTLDISDVNEGTPTLLTGVKTPTDTETNAAATVEYVNAKVSSGGSNDFVVNATISSDMTATLDKTFNQIQAAIKAGKQPVAKWSRGAAVGIMPMVGYNANSVSFMSGMHVDENFVSSQYLSITSAGTVRFYFVNAPAISDSGIMNQVNMSSNPVSDMQIATKKYVDDHLSGAPITIKLGTGNAATSTATFAEIKAALEAGKAPILDSAPGTSHWFALNWTLSGSGSLSIQYGTFNVEGGGMANFTIYGVDVSSTGITYATRQFTTE